mmetsp:Transcript_38661/g.84844  ORF Transcript_38661/g.84844 Transcript_38661/m.84844 type:complete len:403 (+) Transcript_38661:190-1398(+)
MRAPCWLHRLPVQLAGCILFACFMTHKLRVANEGYSHRTINVDSRLWLPGRVFPRWTADEPPCIIDPPPDGGAAQTWHPLDEETQRQPTTAGILMIKIDKAASSTLSGVAARLAHALALWNTSKAAMALPKSQRVCRCRISHAWSLQMESLSRDRIRDKSFLFTMVRDPRTRAISEFVHFKVGLGGVNATDENIIQHLKGVKNFQLGLMVDKEERQSTKSLRTKGDITVVVQRVLAAFDFVGVLERLDETLVLLQLILGLDTNDVLYTSSKRQGNYVFVKSRATSFRGECKGIPSGYVASTAVGTYFTGSEWIENNRGDIALFEAANRSMDLTIEAIGRSEFDYALARFRKMQALADSMCEATLPCSNEGRVRPESEWNCYWLDSGCNYPCLDTVSQNSELK